jgi:ankyrin repeat protein
MSRYEKWPLHAAATQRDLSAAQAAMRNGSKVNQPNDAGLTPLMCAALVNCRPMTEELLANGADVRRVASGVQAAAVLLARGRVLTAGTRAPHATAWRTTCVRHASRDASCAAYK